MTVPLHLRGIYGVRFAVGAHSSLLISSRAQALIVLPSASFYAYRAELITLAARQLLPTIYHQKARLTRLS